MRVVKRTVYKDGDGQKELNREPKKPEIEADSPYAKQSNDEHHSDAEAMWDLWNKASVPGRRAFALRFFRNISLTNVIKWPKE